MDKRFLSIAMFIGSIASVGNLPAEDSQNTSTRQPTLEDRTDQLEQGQQDLKGQVEQLRSEVADLQDRVNRLQGGQSSTQAPPPAGKSADTRGGYNTAQTAGVGPGQFQQSFDVFYQGLQSGGHWFNDPTYGYVWQPDVAVSDENWHPYTDGRWVYTDRGWTWISNEDFGWATYHYGRWARRSDSGWIWIPGSEWAPAWVSWREGRDQVGWAPLPPEVEDNSQVHVENWADNYYDIGPSAYVFVSVADLARPTYREVIAPSDQNVEFLTETKNVTNITHGKDGVVVKGPAYEQLASQAHIPQYKLHYVAENQGRFGINTRGNELQVAAPPATLQRNATMQPKVEKQLAKADLDHGWKQIDQAKASQLKQTMEKQAPVPSNLPPRPAAPKSETGATSNQPAQTTREQQPADSGRTPAPALNQPRTTTQPGTPPKATPAPPVEAAPPRPEATPARPGAEKGGPPAPASDQNRQMKAPTPAGANKKEEPQLHAIPSPSPNRSVEQGEQRQEPPAPRESPSVEPGNQPPEKSPIKEQPKREHQGSNEPAKNQPNEPPRRVEPASRAPANEQGSTPRERQENRDREPATRTEQPAGPKQQPEVGRATEKNQPEVNNPERNKEQMREGAAEQKPKKQGSPSQQRGNQREKQDGQ